MTEAPLSGIKEDESLFGLALPVGLRLEHFGSLIYRKKLFDFRELNHFATLTVTLLQGKVRRVSTLARELGKLYHQPEKKVQEDIFSFLGSLPPGYLQQFSPSAEEDSLGQEETCHVVEALEACWDNLPEKPCYTAPLQFHWEITHQCNLHCIHCYANSASVGKEEVDTLDWEKSISLLGILRKMGVAQINFLGGEPLIEKNFLSLLEKTVEYGMDVTFPSNGVLLSHEKLESLKKLGMRYLTISLDSPDPETFARIRGSKGIFERVTNSIKRAREHEFEVVVNAVLTRLNRDHFPALIELLIKMDVSILKVIDEFPVGRGMENMETLLLNQEDYQDFYHRMLSDVQPGYQDKIEIRLNPRFSFLEPDKGEVNQKGPEQKIDYRCSAGRAQCFCTAEGDIYPCYLFYGERKFLAGNVYHRSFDEIWQDSRSFSGFREIKGNIPDCEACQYATSCKGGCRGEAYKLTGDFFARNPYCWQP